MDEMNKTEGFHEQDTGLVGDFEGNLDNGDEDSQDLSDDEEEGSIQNKAHYCYTTSKPLPSSIFYYHFMSLVSRCNIFIPCACTRVK